MPTVNQVAAQLKQAGFTVTKVEQGTQEYDGAVWLGDKVHVGVSECGTQAWVVAQLAGGTPNEHFKFYRVRKLFSQLVGDLRNAGVQ